ncbi:PREDICTED: tRNA (cytosine(34)-C(5))-methyltransferase-like [Acropora digitifera]|uniref:tRNA (cytosine(34)-C(5))-methyltransferase-like n=1 Tax=Acropora digitifera TaxID=70779 RepID=UPI00077A9E13|nr:PREDICTED: tRNA (cytosine(34)-C(5))-methyltransferase-like [Acropora digitifera]
MARKKREPRQRGRNKSHPKGQWVDVVRKSDLFEQYYKNQHILPEDEFPAFLEALQKELPSTIRITGTRSHAKELSIAMQRLFLTKLDTVEDEEGKTADPPKPLSWYPDELAWQINLTKRFIRKSSSMDRFHKFLVHETETGNISRQEAVSMIPPLLLDIKSGQKILDACAAPGSKTVQLIELLHGEESSGIPDGLVVANELQNKRCYMLVHQSKRLHSPCCLITNHDAAMFPSMFVKTENRGNVPLLFDRILCDVPCSGDGTLRKNPLIWRKWTPQLGLSLFRIQLRILARAVEMLAVGGRIVYSTCTMNPVEDEAVICSLLQKGEGALELVDVSSNLPNLKRSPGLKTWKVMTKGMEIVNDCGPGTEHYAKGFKPPMLAPLLEITDKLHLERCMRVYPHQQDTGGFFIAVLEKKSETPWENDKRCSSNRRLLPWETEADWQRKKQGMCKREETKSMVVETGISVDKIDHTKVKKEDIPIPNEKIMAAHVATENTHCAGSSSSMMQSFDIYREFYGIDDSFPVSQLLVRSLHGKKRNIYLVSKAVKDVMETVDDSHKVINTGMKVFARAENDNVKCSFRLMQEGIEAMLPFISKRKVLITQEDVTILLSQNRPFCDQFSSTTKEQFEKIEGQGCIVYVYDPNGPCSKACDTIRCRLIFCGWKAKVSTRLQVSKFDKAHYQVLCGIQPSDDSFQGKRSGEEEEKSAVEDEDSMERVEVKVEKDDEQTGFIGDFLNVETPKGSLDVGFV